jgi:hypothetical protein
LARSAQIGFSLSSLPRPLARRDQEHPVWLALADVVADRADVGLRGQDLGAGEHHPGVRQPQPLLRVDRVAVGPHARSLGHDGAEVGPARGGLHERLGPGREADAADAPAADIRPALQELDCRVDVRLPRPVESLRVAVALAAAPRVVEEHAVAVLGEERRLLPRALAVATRPVHEHDRSAVPRGRVPPANRQAVRRPEGDVLVRDRERAVDRLARRPRHVDRAAQREQDEKAEGEQADRHQRAPADPAREGPSLARPPGDCDREADQEQAAEQGEHTGEVAALRLVDDDVSDVHRPGRGDQHAEGQG